MSRFKKLAQTIWHCQYHIVWVPKYRFRILEGKIAIEVNRDCYEKTYNSLIVIEKGLIF
jgi:REP element-mobilizing transposase RayT